MMSGEEAGRFRVRVSLERFFSDERARCLMAVSGARRVRWLARRVRRTFQLPLRVALLSRGHLLPPAEPLAMLRPDEPVEVVPATAVVVDPTRPRSLPVVIAVHRRGGEPPSGHRPARALPVLPPRADAEPAALAPPPPPPTPPPPPPPPPPPALVAPPPASRRSAARAGLDASGERALGKMKRYALHVLERFEEMHPPAPAPAPAANAVPAACPHRRRTRTRRRHRMDIVQVIREPAAAPAPAPVPVPADAPPPALGEAVPAVADADSTVEDVVRNAPSDPEALRRRAAREQRRAARVVRALEAAPPPPPPGAPPAPPPAPPPPPPQ